MSGLFALFTQAAPQPSTVLQAIWLGTLILFIISVFTAGFTAKKIENIHNPTYSKAFLALILIGPFSLAGFMMFGLFFQAPPIVALIIGYSIIPIAIYKIVFGSMWSEAAVIWIVTAIVQAGATYGLILAGVVSLASFTGGA
jgi:hypothetical protein